MSALVRCTCSATGRILSSAKRWNVSAASSNSSGRWRGPGARRRQRRGERLEERGGAVRLDERQRRRRARAVDAPRRRRGPMSARAEVGDGVGDERAASIDSTSPCSRVREHHPAAFERARRVREVVREHLVLVELVDADATVDAGRVGEMLRGRVDDFGRAVDAAAAAGSWSGMGEGYRRPCRRVLSGSVRSARLCRGRWVVGGVVVAWSRRVRSGRRAGSWRSTVTSWRCYCRRRAASCRRFRRSLPLPGATCVLPASGSSPSSRR